MAASILDKLTRVTDSTTGRPVIATMAAPGKTVGAPSVTLNVATNWTTTTKVHVAMYTVTSAGVKDPTSQTDWAGTLSGTTLSNLTLTGGTDRTYVTGSYVEITPTAAWAKDLYDWGTAHANTDGSLKTAAVQTALSLGAGSLNGWNALGYAPNTVTANGNRSYTCTFNAVDLTGTLSPGMRLQTTRTVAAPTQSTSLNGTTQYYSKTSPAGMAQTDSITAIQWLKPSAYQSGHFQSKSTTPGTDGWRVYMNADGTVSVNGNARFATTYQSLALNKWTHVAATLSMSTSTVNIYFDGILVPSSALSSTGASFTNSGSYTVGAGSAGTQPFAGKIAQVGFFSAILTQATIRSYMSQGLIGTETSLVSAYSFNASTSDLNTTNANNLTANGSAVATNADSPFGGQASGLISSTLDYAIVQSATFSTNTTLVVQVPEGCTIPTSGGVSSVVYSSSSKPYGMPLQRSKWKLTSLWRTQVAVASNATFQPFTGWQLTVPTGSWDIGWAAGLYTLTTTAVYWSLSGTSQTGLAFGASDLTLQAEVVASTAGTTVPQHYLRDLADVTSQTAYVMYTQGATTSAGIVGQNTKCEIFAENAYL